MRHLLSFLVALAVTEPAVAGSTLDPVVVDIDNGRGAFSVTNVTNSATGYEVRALDWSVDENGADVLTPTDNLVVFPPLFRLAPGQTITLRLREAIPPTQAENAYRLEITEEPPEVEGTGVGIQMQYRTSAFSSEAEWAPSVACRVINAGQLRLTNEGRRRTSIDEVISDGTDITAEVGLSGRVILAGAARTITLPKGRSGVQVRLQRGGRVDCR